MPLYQCFQDNIVNQTCHSIKVFKDIVVNQTCHSIKVFKVNIVNQTCNNINIFNDNVVNQKFHSINVKSPELTSKVPFITFYKENLKSENELSPSRKLTLSFLIPIFLEPNIFKSMNSVRSDNLSLKYLRFIPSDCIDMGIRRCYFMLFMYSFIFFLNFRLYIKAVFVQMFFL